MFKILLPLLLGITLAQAKEIALTFDDAPIGSTGHFETHARTAKLIQKLKALHVPQVMIFANACWRNDPRAVVQQLKKYTVAGHRIGNHTCSHPRLDEVGFEKYTKNAAKGDQLLAPLFRGQKFFRFPFLNEGTDTTLRDQMRDWLVKNQYRNGMVSVDNDDYFFSFKINQAKEQKKKINYGKVKKLFLEHVVGAANFYDALAVKTLGYSPKHVMLLHEMDATVMFIDSLVNELRKQGWKIIGIEEAYKDKVYLEQPKNTYAGNGILAQLALEKTGERQSYGNFEELKAKLNSILGLNSR